MRINTVGRAMRIAAVALALGGLVGCQGHAILPAGPAGAAPQAPMEAPAGERRLLAIPWSAGSWADGLRIGAQSAYWGNDPLGYGYLPGGLLPFVSRGGLDGLGPSLFLADLGGATVYQVPALPVGANFPTLSRGGRFATFEDAGELQELDLRTNLIRTFPQLSRRHGYGVLDFDADAFGNVTYVDGLGRLHMFDARSGNDFIVPAAGRGVDIGNVSLSGDGRFVAYTGRTGFGSELFVTDVVSGRQFSPPFLGGQGLTRDLAAFALSPRGDALLYADNGQARLLDLHSGFTNNLPLLNSGGWVNDAQFLGGDAIGFTRGGQVQVFHPQSGLIDTLPLLNRELGQGLLRRHDRFSYGRIF